MAKNAITIDSKKLEKELQQALKRNPKVTAKTVKSIVLDLAGRSAQLAPVDTGDLRSNCVADVNGTKVFENKVPTGTDVSDSEKVTGKVGYSLPYAVRQHEELSYNHPKGGQAKFLEKPFIDNEQKYIDKLKAIPEEVLK